MMSDTTVSGETEAEVEAAAPVGELTELARLEMRIGKIVEVHYTYLVAIRRRMRRSFSVFEQLNVWRQV